MPILCASLSPPYAAPMTFVQQLAEHLGLDADAARDVLEDWVEHIRHQLRAEGQTTIQGLGVFRRFNGTIVFEPTQELARMVNSRFTGLEDLTVSAGPEPMPAAALPGEADALELQETEPGEGIVGIYPITPTPEETPPPEPPAAEPEASEFAPPAASALPEEHAPETTEPAEPTLPEPAAPDEAEPEAEVLPPEPVALDEKATAAEPDLAEAFPSSPASSGVARPVEPEDQAAQPPPRERPEEPERRSRWPLLLVAVLLLAIAGVVAVVLMQEEEPELSATPPIAEGQPPAADPGPSETEAGPEGEAGTAAPSEQEPAETTPPEPETTPPPAEPAVEETPLRGTGGIDRGAGGFSLIVASSTQRELAEEVAAPFREEGYRTDILAERVDGVMRYRAAIGQFPTLAAAGTAREELAGELPDGTWVLRIRPDM